MTAIKEMLPYTVISPCRPRKEVADWCNINIGQKWEAVRNRTGVWTCFWAGSILPRRYIWYFNNEAAALIFSLRWS